MCFQSNYELSHESEMHVYLMIMIMKMVVVVVIVVPLRYSLAQPIVYASVKVAEK